jgi:hypothetical protein
LKIRRYSVIRTATVASLGYIVLALLLVLTTVTHQLASGQTVEFIPIMCLQIPLWAIGVWCATALVVLTYNLLLARFGCLKIEIEVEDEEDKTEPGVGR